MELNLKATELRLGLPGIDEEKVSSSGSGGYVVRSSSSNKRSSPEQECCKSNVDSNATTTEDDDNNIVQPAKVQVVGWPPIRSYRKNSMQQQRKKKDSGDGMFVKVSMTGAPYLRKIDVKVYKSYSELLKALQNLFNCTFGEYSEREGYNGSQHVPTYEDKDGDWMLVGDVPFQMFMSSCKRLRIMKGSEAKGLGCF